MFTVFVVSKYDYRALQGIHARPGDRQKAISPDGHVGDSDPWFYRRILPQVDPPCHNALTYPTENQIIVQRFAPNSFPSESISSEYERRSFQTIHSQRLADQLVVGQI